MADIDQIIAGGAGASSRADFSGIADIPKSFFEGNKARAEFDLRRAFKDGVPLTADGQPDFGAMAKTLFQKGGLAEGTAASNLDIQRQKLQYGPAVDAAISGTPPQSAAQPIISPSANRGAPVTDRPPVNRGAQPQAQPSIARGPQGDQQGSIVGLVSAAGVPDELAGPIIQQVSAALRSDPNATLNPQIAPRAQQIVAEAVRRAQSANQPQPQQAPPQAQTPQVPPQVAPQAVAPQGGDPRVAGLVPPGRSPEQQIQLLSRAIASGNLPVEQAKLYQNRIDAITKAIEPTDAEKQFQASRRNPGLDDYTAQAEAAKASAKGVAEADIKEQNDLIGQGKAASNRLTTLNTLKGIIDSDQNLTLGFGGPTALKVKMALESLGVPVPDLSGAQAIQKLNASLASEMAKSLTSRTTQFEFKTFLGNNPGLELDKNGNQRLIGIFSQLAKRDVDLGKLARQNRDNWTNWDQVVENYDKKNPMRDPVTNKVLSTDSIVAPGSSKAATSAAPSASISSKADYDKLPSGATFTGPDGKPWRKP